MGLSAESYATLDPSILCLPHFWTQPEHVAEPLFLHHYRGDTTQAKRGFWRFLGRRRATVRPDWEPDPVRVNPTEFAQRSFEIVPEERIEKLQNAAVLDAEPKDQDVPYAITNMMTERNPQFFLRNLPRVERYVDLQSRTHFDIKDMPFVEAADALESSRQAELPKIEFAEHWSAPLIDDFRIFLEEVLYLCPWEELPRGAQPPPEDSLWSSNHSRATLTYELITRKDTVTIWGQAGVPKTLARSERVTHQQTYGPATSSDDADDSDRMG